MTENHVRGFGHLYKRLIQAIVKEKLRYLNNKKKIKTRENLVREDQGWLNDNRPEEIVLSYDAYSCT